jgi:5-methylcytosine-specific restriction endonuclease McrA
MNSQILQRPTLVLNRNWQPVNVATVARALVLLWNETACVVDVADYQTFTWDDWSKLRPQNGESFIQAISTRLRVPEVIALAKYDRLPASAVTFSRRNIFKRDRYVCQYCGNQPPTDELTIDHVVPRAQGGVSSWTNCVLACMACNKRKADRTPREAGMLLRHQPTRPSGSRFTPTTTCASKAGRSLSAKCTGMRNCRSKERQETRVERQAPEIICARYCGSRLLTLSSRLHTSVLLGEQPVSKTGPRGSTPCARACEG